MSRQLINEYRADLDRLRAVSGSRRESVLREAFKDLLKRWGRTHDLLFVPEHAITTPQKNRIYLDGALLHALRVPFGYWEAKDADDDLDAEIVSKTRKGYPRDNIIYSDDHTAVLIQDGHEVGRVAMDDTDALYPLIVRFYGHERQEIADFNKAVKQFAQDLPAVLSALRDLIAEKRAAFTAFAAAERAFLKHAQDAINPAVTEADVQEMLIQHILTEDIFAKVFDNPDFHRQNNVASELYKLEEKLFARGEKSTLLRALSPYYSGIAQTAAVIQSHSEKQGFLKGLYENFYKVYNSKAADRLGVVYTPGEIVRFMIRSTDWLCEKHFGKNLVDRGVEILDPATGTGTFIVELLEHFRGHHGKLRHKYKEELHANEVAILPYYVANLNIEATYQAITGQFAEFENLCFVDTLDNVDALGIHAGHQFDLLGSLTDENIERIKKQNRRKISVIIGNPPYNANQQNENDNNKNRAYAHIDQRIKDTYIKASTAHKTKMYDMYVRFFRWAADRLEDKGVLAFITNRSFIDKRGFDGFRGEVLKDFSHVVIVDLGGDWKGDASSGGSNVFGIGTGVAITFAVKGGLPSSRGALYFSLDEDFEAEEKLLFLDTNDASTLDFSKISPTKTHEWREIPENAFPNFLPIALAKLSRQSDNQDRNAIFTDITFGCVSNRDDWVYAQTASSLVTRVNYYLETYEATRIALPRPLATKWENALDYTIKWSQDLRKYVENNKRIAFNKDALTKSLYRPYTKLHYYYSNDLNWSLYRMENIFPTVGFLNSAIVFSDPTSQKPFLALATDGVFDLHLVGAASGSLGVGRFRSPDGKARIDNITDWALNKFVKEYGKKGVTKDAIFHYVYAVLHDPVYRETYALNLKREFPRIPFYPDFVKWVAWGEALMALHIDYEDVAPWPVERIDTPGTRATGTHPKPTLKSQPGTGDLGGVVVIDADTQLAGIPAEAWSYRLGNRSAIDWVLDQHKEKKPRDPTIAAKFNTYRLADYKESLIALLAKVVRVSVDTVEITKAMSQTDRSP